MTKWVVFDPVVFHPIPVWTLRPRLPVAQVVLSISQKLHSLCSCPVCGNCSFKRLVSEDCVPEAVCGSPTPVGSIAACALTLSNLQGGEPACWWSKAFLVHCQGLATTQLCCCQRMWYLLQLQILHIR